MNSRFCRGIAAALVILTIGGAAQGQSKSALDLLTQSVISGRIDRVIVYQAIGVDTNHQMAPQSLTLYYTQKLEYRIENQRQRDSLVAMLKSTTVAPSDRGADVRAGIIFIESDHGRGSPPDTGKRYGIFCDEFGKFGYMGEIGKDWQHSGGPGNGISINGAMLSFISRLFYRADR
jgi:hypothetical protein